MKSTTTFMNVRSVRITGLLYLLVIICAGFSQGYVRASLIVPGEAAITATNIMQNELLYRWGLTADMIAFILDAVISILLYQMLKPYGKTLAMVSSAMRLLAHPAIGMLNLLNHYMALHVLGGIDFLSGLGVDQIESLSLLFTDAHRNGYLIAGSFFGVHCILLGWLIVISDMIPRFFGVMMIVAGISYLMETFGDFLFPGNEAWLALLVGFAAALGEVGLTLYMLIKGARRSYAQNIQTATL